MMTMLDDANQGAKPGKPVKILLAVAGGEAAVNAALVAGAKARLAAAAAEVEEIALARVIDLPQALALAETMQDFDGYVALGVVIGEPHLWADVSRALTGLGMGGGLNGNGIVLADSAAAALVAADPLGADAGGQAAASVLALVALATGWKNRTKGIGFRA
jgi:6,7-dimethyl-8-ribityllumazine synthase